MVVPVRVSVVVRTRNRPDFVRRALADIQAQTFTDYEVVIVDDGDSGSFLAEIVDSSGMPRVRLVRTDAPRGRCRAANMGIRSAEGDLVVLHDDDDRWHPEFLARTVSRLDEDPDIVGVMTATSIIYERRIDSTWRETDRVPFWGDMQRISLIELLEINRAVPISFLYRRAVHDVVGWYDETLDAVEDWDLYLRIVPRLPVAFLGGEPLAFWVQRPDAKDAEANSTLGLLHEHERDDLLVRDRELAAWVRENGVGLPLYLAHVERRIIARLSDRIDATIRHEVRSIVAQELDARSPLGRRWRLWRRGRSGRS